MGAFCSLESAALHGFWSCRKRSFTTAAHSARQYATFLQAVSAATRLPSWVSLRPQAREVAILLCPERRKASAHPVEGNPFCPEATVFENSTACAPRPAYGRECVQVRRRDRKSVV